MSSRVWPEEYRLGWDYGEKVIKSDIKDNGTKNLLFSEVNIDITGEMVGEKDCEPGANISNEWTKGSYWEIGGV